MLLEISNNNKKMRSIKTHLTITLLLFMLLPTGLIGTTTYWLIYNGIKENRIKDVGYIADARHEELRMHLHRDDQRGKALLDSLISCRHSDGGINDCARAKMEQFAATNHAVGFTFHSGIENDFSYGSNAISSDKLNKLFLPGQIAAISTINGASLFSLIAADPASGFSLVTTYPGQDLQDIFVDSKVLGQSGEIFLTDNKGFFITKPRYPSEQQGVNISISSIPMQHCLGRESGAMLHHDYRGASIIHGFRFVPEIGGGCIMAHIDQAEAFAPLRQLVMGLGIVAFLFACSAWLIARMSSRSMSRSIIALADMAGALSRGDFTQRVSSTNYREIAELSHLFNNMAGQLDITLSRLKTSEHELEKKVLELHERHKKYDSVIQSISEGFWQVNEECYLMEVNPAYAHLSGYSAAELVGMRIADLEAQESPEQTAQHIRDVMLYGTDVFETRHRRKDGSLWNVEVSTSFINENGGYFVSFFRDISARREIEDKLKASEVKFRSIIEACPVPMVLNNQQMNITFLNPAFVQAFGYSVDDIPTLADWWSKAYPDPDYRYWAVTNWQAILEKAKQDHTELPSLEVAIRCKNDGIKTVLVSAATIHHDFAGEHLMILYDITPRKQIEAKFNAIFAASVEGIITYDKANIIVSANAAVETIFGYKPEELVGYSINKLLPSSPSSSSPQAAERVGQIEEVEGLHKNGSVVPLDLSVAEYSINDTHYFTGIVRDVSLRKHREQQDKEHLDELAHVTRLGLMGEMASGIAHEVNQPLSAISSYTQVSLNLINTESPDLVKLTEILYKTQQQALRAGQIIHRMRKFVKSHSIHRLSADINALIHEAVGLCIADLKQNGIRLAFELENNLPTVYVDHVQIEQVIINLLRNSIDALNNLPAGQQRYLSIQSRLTLNNNIQVRVKDNGAGLDKDQQQKVLTPFYTTKADGMGMGLSISRSLIEAHDGTLHFNSHPGKGTTFYFTLPIQKL
ncbi:MAG: PAS domain S-box protein [Methylobacter sp.]